MFDCDLPLRASNQRRKDWEHIAEIVGEVYKGEVPVTKNRYAPKNALNFFEQFGIKCQEPIDKKENTNN